MLFHKSLGGGPAYLPEMCLISFIYKRVVIKMEANVREFEILTHLNEYKERKNERAPPKSKNKYSESVEIVPYDDGWPGYEEPSFICD